MIHKFFNQKRKREVNGPVAAVLRYDSEHEGVPKIVAQGKGQVANKIMELAKANGIPMQEDSMLVENLIDMDLGDNIPPQLYHAVAEILLMLEEMEKNIK